MSRSLALLALVLVVVVAGCSQRTAASLPAVPHAERRCCNPDAAFASIYDFKALPDGSGPAGALLPSSGTLYGTTANGGTKGFGAIFKLSTTGTERVLHSFAGAPTDGRAPTGALIFSNGAYYGTTALGGKHDYGTIFKMTPAGAEHVLYSFNNNPDGQSPASGLVAVNGAFYGTTQFGGTYGLGSVFKVSSSGVETVVYSFNGNTSPPDGVNPVGDLVFVNGALYGTTLNGGTGNHGTIFKVSPSGVEKVIYAFKGTPDGSTPYAGLIYLNGKLFGTTWFAGANSKGTVFQVSTSGVEKVLYSFKGMPDGEEPQGRLIALNGMLYGTTSQGGASTSSGTVFKVSLSGTEQVRYRFAGAPNDGSDPIAGLASLGGALYGTTNAGGTGNTGTVFKGSP